MWDYLIINPVYPLFWDLKVTTKIKLGSVSFKWAVFYCLAKALGSIIFLYWLIPSYMALPGAWGKLYLANNVT